MAEKRRILVGMSGGVDSSAAALLLQRQGWEVGGLTFQLWDNPDGSCGTQQDVQDAANVCARLGIPHYVVDFRQQFREQVIDRFVDCYIKGLTPNPCVECNRAIKFGAFLDKAEELGYGYIATGHYGRVEQSPEDGRYHLLMAEEDSKDQSYVLYSLTQRQLARMVLPLYGYTKPQVRQLAREAGLPVHAKKDSQDICFIPDGDVYSFLCRTTGRTPPQGDFIDREGNCLGRHQGTWRYTIGQRRGLGVGFGQRMFVCGINPQAGTVTLTAGEGLFSNVLLADELNFIECDWPAGPTRVTAKIRYAARPAAATLFPLEHGRVRVEFDAPQRAITPGQAVVFYQGRRVFGGGRILAGKASV